MTIFLRVILSPTLRRLVIKPTMACTASCPTCSLRLDLYTKRSDDGTLDFEQWQAVIQDAYHMGCRDLHISGGEPTLYAHLVDLIQFAARLGMVTNVNTNSSVVSPKMAEELANAGLDSVTVSIYSHKAEIHDRARQEPALFGKAIRAIQYFQAQPGLQVDLQTLLSNYNLLDFDQYLHMAYALHVGYVYVSYLEGDREQRWLPDARQIEQFRDQVIPRLEQIVTQNAPPDTKDEAHKAIRAMFSDNREVWQQFASGIYFPDHRLRCPRPYDFALVLANGEVHPCNGVEYTHDPVMGNVFEHELHDLWENETWEHFRVQRHAWCYRCPMTLHFRIPIMGERQ